MKSQDEGYYLQVRYRPVGDLGSGWRLLLGAISGPMIPVEADTLKRELEYWAIDKNIPVEYRIIRLEVVE